MQSRFLAVAVVAQVALAGDSYLQTFKNLNDHTKDDFYLDEDFHRDLQTPYVDDINKGFGQYGQYNEHGVNQLLDLNQRPRKFIKDLDPSAFAAPGCYEGCDEHSGAVVTIIPAKKVETRTYQKSNHQGDNKANYNSHGKEDLTWSLNGELQRHFDACGELHGDQNDNYNEQGFLSEEHT